MLDSSYIFRRLAHLLELVEEVPVGTDLLRDAALEALPVLLAVLGVGVIKGELNAVVRGALRGEGWTHSNATKGIQGRFWPFMARGTFCSVISCTSANSIALHLYQLYHMQG